MGWGGDIGVVQTAEPKNLVVGFDLRYLQSAYRNSSNGGLGGIGVYSRGLWSALARLFPEMELVALVDHGPLPEKLLEVIQLAPRHKIVPFGLAGRGTIISRLERSRYSWIPRMLESRYGLGMSSKSASFDILHILSQSPAPLSGVCPVVVTIYDLVMLETGLISEKTLAGKIYRKHLTGLGKADRLVCISESTKKDVEKFLPGCEDKIELVYPGVNLDIFKPEPTSREEVKAKWNIVTDYFIHVGVCFGTKNPHVLLEAMSIAVSSSRKDFVLIFVGPYQVNKSAKDMIYRIAKDYGIEHKVIILGDVTDVELAILYRHALSLVFPSLYEGFGYPAIECLACGTPCIVSNTSSLPEVVGKWGVLVDPHNARQIADEMIKIVECGKSKIIQREGPRWAKNFTWVRAAVDYMKIYQKLAGESKRQKV